MRPSLLFAWHADGSTNTNFFYVCEGFEALSSTPIPREQRGVTFADSDGTSGSIANMFDTYFFYWFMVCAGGGSGFEWLGRGMRGAEYLGIYWSWGNVVCIM